MSPQYRSFSFLPFFILLFCGIFLFSSNAVAGHFYSWLKGSSVLNADQIRSRFLVPKGFVRLSVKRGSFAYWLRRLPLKKGRSKVMLHNGGLHSDQSSHAAVVKIDIGRGDLQQCADATMRLRAEYLFSKRRFQHIHFKFTSGHNASYISWRRGYRPKIKGRHVRWVKRRGRDSSYKNFRRYLRIVFMYAGTYSLSRELPKVKARRNIQIGDVFVDGGFPGHAVIVIDMIKSLKTSERRMLLAQSFMPAQSIHLLRNPNSRSPWYSVRFGKTLITPHWKFTMQHLRRFREK